LEAFYDNPNALRDYFRDIGRMVLAAEGRKANDSHADCYQYFCVPEYGTANGRLHFHEIGRAVQQECRDRSRMPSSACKKNGDAKEGTGDGKKETDRTRQCNDEALR